MKQYANGNPIVARPNRASGADFRLLREDRAGGFLKVFWQSGPLLVSSSLEMTDMPDGSGEQGLTWLLAVSFGGKRAKAHHVRRALRAFDMVGAEEDNHHPGITRSFFLVCDPKRRVDCECKATEQTIVEPGGYRWTNPTNEACRGCEYEALTGKRCPLHARPAVPT